MLSTTHCFVIVMTNTGMQRYEQQSNFEFVKKLLKTERPLNFRNTKMTRACGKKLNKTTLQVLRTVI